MGKILNFVAHCIIIIVALPVCTIELVFKVVAFITVCAILIAMMFFAPLFKNFSWPKSIDKFIDYVFSLNFVVTGKMIDAYKNALDL